MEDEEFMKILNEELQKQQAAMNSAPIEDFDNLSANDMHNIVYFPFEQGCPLQFKTRVEESVLDDIPFFNLMEYYLKTIHNHKEIKLTTRGNLPVKLVKELYKQAYIKEEKIEDGICKLNRESDSMSIQNIKIIAELAGLVKMRDNKLTLKKGTEKYFYSENRTALLQTIFKTYGYKFNLAFHDGYKDEEEVQQSLGYTIYLLLKYGAEKRPYNFYPAKVLTAYPHMKSVFKASSYQSSEAAFASCFTLRIMERFLNWFNLVEVIEEEGNSILNKKSSIKNKYMEQVFYINKANFKFRKGKFTA